MGTTWEERVAAVWSTAPQITRTSLVDQIDELVAERPAADAEAVFEAASARDYADRESEAEPLYRRALGLGLDEPLRGQATIQLASTLRNLGRPADGVTVLQDGFAEHPDHPLTDAARAFLALCLADSGDERAATAVALDALSTHLPQYGRAVRAYAADLMK